MKKYELVAFGAPYGEDGEVIAECNTYKEADKTAKAILNAGQSAKLFYADHYYMPLAWWSASANGKSVEKLQLPEPRVERVAVKYNSTTWVIATRGNDGKWYVAREHGIAHGVTPKDAAIWAFADRGQPAEMFKTKHEAMLAIADEVRTD